MNLVKQKLKASGIHFIISLSFISVSLLLALKFWYPGPFFEILKVKVSDECCLKRIFFKFKIIF